MTRENFKLQKVKLLKNGGLSVKWINTEVIGADSFDNRMNIESPKDIHPDLITKLKSLSKYLLTIRGYSNYKLITESRDYKATESQKEAINKTTLDLQDRFNVTGIACSGENENKKVVITFNFEEDNGQLIGSATHAIILSADKYGYEDDILNTVNEIEDEVYAYLYQNKRAQLEIDFNETIDSDNDD